MRNPAIAALLCVLVVSIAGCAGQFGGGSGTTDAPTTSPPDTTSPMSTTETTPPTTSSPAVLAPGLTTDGVTDALKLADAHREQVYNQNFIKESERSEENDTASAHLEETLYYANESHWLWNKTGDGMPIALGVTDGTLVQYADGEEVRYMVRSDESTRYGVRKMSTRDDLPPMPPEDALGHVYARDLIFTLFSADDITVERGDEVAAHVSGSVSETTIQGEPATDVEFTATVTEAGLVTSLDLSYRVGDTQIERTLTFNRTGTDPVDRPDWYAQAGNSSA